jgi:hypothetical protein
LDNFQLKDRCSHTELRNEKWKKEARLDIRTGSRTEDNGAQEGARCKNCQEAKTI